MAFDTGFYPPQVFPESVRKLIIFFLPGTLFSFGPVLALRDTTYLMYYIISFSIFMIFAVILWKTGLKRYESVGY